MKAIGRCGATERQAKIGDHTPQKKNMRPDHHILSPRPRPRAQVSASLRPCGRAELALPRRCAGCRPDGAAPRAKVLSWPLISSRRYSGLLWSTSGPNGPRRRKRRRVPVNPGRRAGDAARETAAERAVGRAAGDLPPRPPPEASVGSRRAASSAVATPRVTPGPPTPVHELARPTEMLFVPSPPSGLDALPQTRSRRGCCQRRQCCPGALLAHRSVEGGSATAPRSFLGVTRLLQCLGGHRSRSDLFRCLSPPPWSGGGGC